MCAVVPDRSVELSPDGHRGEHVELVFEARGEHRHLLADGGRGRGLTMRARDHRGSRMFASESAHRRRECLHRRRQHLLARVAEHHRVGEVVDVFRRACEVDECARSGELGRRSDSLADKILDRLDVVIGFPLDRLDPQRVFESEAVRDVVEALRRFPGQGCEGIELRARRERLQPGDLDPDPISDERVLARDAAKRGGPGAVSPVDRRNRGQRGELHRPAGVIPDGRAVRRTPPAAPAWIPAGAWTSIPNRASRR